MIESIEIENFRGFRELQLSGFRRINIIVGDNGAGKTGFLEAIYLAASQSVESVAKLRLWRGGQAGQLIGLRTAYLAAFGDLFTDFDLRKIIRITILGSDGHRKTLRVFASQEPQILPLLDTEKGKDVSAPVTFEWSEPGGSIIYSVAPQIHSQGLLVSPSSITNKIEVGLLAARTPVHASESAQYFSDLSIANKEKPFIDAMKKLFDDIKSINVEIFSGTPSLFASLKYHSRKYPIHILSDGMNKISAILLGIASKPKGIFMVDEIESGLYFRRQSPVLAGMREMANHNGTQIFASTHSLEFLNALSPIMAKYPDDFSLIRIYQEDGWGRATILDGKRAISLIKSGLEIRM
jgi:ABC-type branched-subunit amino acid transport system ATPase component